MMCEHDDVFTKIKSASLTLVLNCLATTFKTLIGNALRSNFQVDKWNLSDVLNSMKILDVDFDLVTMHKETK